MAAAEHQRIAEIGHAFDEADQKLAARAMETAGSLAAQRKVPESAGTLPTTGPLFATLLGGAVVLVAALTFIPALALGPIAEALL